MSSPPPDTTPPPSPTVRPWSLFATTTALSLPISFSDATHRISKNLRYFSGNYLLLLLSIFLLSLVPRPLSLFLFLLLSAAWIYLFFSCAEPLELFGFDVDEKLVLGFLSLVTFVALLVVRVWVNVFVSVGVGAVVVCLHAAIRAPEDPDDSPYGALLSESPRGNYTIV